MFTNGLMPPLHPTILNDIFWVSQDCGSMLHVCVYVEMAMFPPSVFVAFTSDWNVTLRLGPVSITENKKWSHSAKQDSCIEDCQPTEIRKEILFTIQVPDKAKLTLSLGKYTWTCCDAGQPAKLTQILGITDHQAGEYFFRSYLRDISIIVDFRLSYGYNNMTKNNPMTATLWPQFISVAGSILFYDK